jgi:hypothetical protein
MKTPLPEHPEPHTYTWTKLEEESIRAAMVAAYNEAMEDAASAIDPLEEWRGIDEKAYLIAVGIAKCIRELKKETP